MVQLVTGYLPSVILVIFLICVPPVMMLLSAIEGPISRSGRKKSACCKVLYFTIWNVFFVNVFAGSVISQLSVFTSITELPAQLAKAVPVQVMYSCSNMTIFYCKLCAQHSGTHLIWICTGTLLRWIILIGPKINKHYLWTYQNYAPRRCAEEFTKLCTLLCEIT
jgi:hypothetical protein